MCKFIGVKTSIYMMSRKDLQSNETYHSKCLVNIDLNDQSYGRQKRQGGTEPYNSLKLCSLWRCVLLICIAGNVKDSCTSTWTSTYYASHQVKGYKFLE